jgi:hypothetical protein
VIIPSFHASRVARAAAGGGGDVTPNEVNWGFPYGQSIAISAMLQITGITSTITLRVAFTGNQINQKYSVQSTASFGTGTAIANNGTFTISNNQYLGFSSETTSGTESTFWTITNVSDGNAVIDTFQSTAFVSSGGECFLTTAVVNYMGGLDNGPELAAMRMLRDHYNLTQGYVEKIQDYYTYSPLIIKEIEAGVHKAATYLNIYATVKSCESLVMAGEWEKAWDKYMAMFLDLKMQYLHL